MPGGPPPILLLLLGGLWQHPARAGSHSLRYFHSSLSEGLPGAPRFSSVGYVDDETISAYSSRSRSVAPRAPWMGRVAESDPQYWERETETLRGSEAVERADVRTVMGRHNQTAGLHVFQWMYGCELRGDGSIGGFSQFAYDGRDFLSFDKEHMKFTAAMNAATLTADRWNRESEAQRVKDYLEHRCIEWLQKYLDFGRESLLRRVPPQMMISRRKTEAATTLICYAYGFYPMAIGVKCVRNEVEVDWKTKTILPNPDGTYQIRTTVELPEEHNEKDYSCVVDHLGHIISKVYEKSGTPIWIIVTAITVVAFVVLGVPAAIIFKRKFADWNLDPSALVPRGAVDAVPHRSTIRMKIWSDKIKTAANQANNIYVPVQTKGRTRLIVIQHQLCLKVYKPAAHSKMQELAKETSLAP